MPKMPGSPGQGHFGTFELVIWDLGSTRVTKVGAVLATLCLGFVVANCTSGPSARVSGPSAKDIAACAPMVKVKLPPVKLGMGLAIALPTKQAENLIDSGNPRLAETGHIFTQPENRVTSPESGDRNVYVDAFLSAQAECRKLGVG